MQVNSSTATGGQGLTKAQIKRINDEMLNPPLCGGGSGGAEASDTGGNPGGQTGTLQCGGDGGTGGNGAAYILSW